MTQAHQSMRDHLRELERAFVAFERGDQGRLYESRESLAKLGEAIEEDGWFTLTPICEIANRLLGVALMEHGLSDQRAVQVVRELLEYVEGEIARANQSHGDAAPGGVFHVVNSKKVGELLVDRGLVKREEVEKALVLQRVRRGRRVGEVLVAMNVIDRRTLDEMLELQRRETRAEETRRTGRGDRGAPTAGRTAIPPMPGTVAGAGEGLSLERPPAAPEGGGADGHGPAGR